MVILTWNDANLNKGFSSTKAFFYTYTCLFSVLLYFSVISVVIKVEFIQKILPAGAALYFAYAIACNLYIITKGSKYVKSISKENELFVVTNIFNKRVCFIFTDICSVKKQKLSILEKLLIGISNCGSGFDLILNDKNKYRITSDMEDIDSLKQHFLGLECRPGEL